MESSNQVSVRKVAQELDLYATAPSTTAYAVQGYETEMQVEDRSQVLTDDHKRLRVNFSEWILNSNIDVQKVIFTDEKFFFSEIKS